MKWSCQLLVLLSLCGATSAFSVIKFGACPKVPVQQNFDVTRYIGKWWEYERFPAPFEFGSVCSYANYTLLSPTKIKVVNRGIQELKFFVVSRKPVEAIGEAVAADPTQPAKLSVSFGGMPPSNNPNYFVVETDYDNTAVVFSCTNYGVLNVQFAWILTRRQGERPSNIDQIYSNLQRYGVNTRSFISVRQTNC